MNKFAVATITAGAMASLTLALTATATAAPTGWSDAEQTVETLQSSGYRVQVNRSGTAPLSECTVDSVRRGPTAIGPNVGPPSDTRNMAVTVVVNASC
ncbi:hypothetical protein [Mycolicibacterium arseniciresistens]|uniref:PASTA domain-containing protein n=1 Tax=Mycolicibacterium arseniciresistens TaxID=3062257 RepID=A0ABT8UCH9_9MYCO|nr:hypothetical protein [Mycolicibacterium arseniciresistens]MDO3635483.1 hypothetical protein [Mycolicibacterium arseniciresistens]